jgi:hypothetical protein
MNDYSRNIFLSKIYIWGIIFEPQLFFIILPATVVGFNITIAKLLEILLIIFIAIFSLLAFKYNLKFKIRLPEINSTVYVFIYLFILSLLASFIFGFFYGSFDINLSNIQRHDFYNYQLDQKIITDGLIEIFILCFYFFFFSFMPSFFLDTRKKLEYFFLNFRRCFFFFLIIGYLDFFIAMISGSTFDLIPRHLFDGVQIGERLHGTAGEPRQAAVYLIFGLAVLNLESYFTNKENSKLLFILIILALLLTQSVSMLIALFIYIIIMFFIFLFELSAARLGKFLLVVTLSILTGFLVFKYDDFFATYLPRLGEFIRYGEAFSDVWFILESQAELPYHIKIQVGEVFPIYDLIKIIQNGEIMRVMFGSGSGSAALNNYSYMNTLDAYGNPNAQGIRLLYESGIIGSCLYFLAFFTPIRILTSGYDKKIRLNFYNYMALILAICLALRSPVVYIYLGVFISSLTLMNNQRIYKEQLE